MRALTTMSLRLVVVAVAVARLSSLARADGPPIADDTWPVTSTGNLAVDGGVVVGFPAALPTGLSQGVGAGISIGRRLVWGVRLSWGSATESTMAWIVSHSDYRLRLTGGIQTHAGRGTIGLRLGVGPTFVHETRDRQQGMRAGLTGTDLHQTALATVGSVDLEAVVLIHIAGTFGLVISGGPTAQIRDGGVHGGWSAELGVAWQP